MNNCLRSSKALLISVLLLLGGCGGSNSASTSTAAHQLTLNTRANRFATCISKIPGAKWQTSTPKLNRPTEWDSLPTEKVDFGGRTLAVHAGTLVLPQTPSFWSSIWVANSPAEASQAAKILGDPKNESSTSNMVVDASRSDRFGSWYLTGDTPKDPGHSQVIESDSTPSDADIAKMDSNLVSKVSDGVIRCAKEQGLFKP